MLIFVTHDISSIKNLCENLAILKNGEIIEYGKTTNILKNTQERDVITQKIDEKVAKENERDKESENSQTHIATSRKINEKEISNE